MNEEQENQDQELQKIFPLFKTWNRLYLFVIGELIVLILLFYWFSRYFS